MYLYDVDVYRAYTDYYVHEPYVPNTWECMAGAPLENPVLLSEGILMSDHATTPNIPHPDFSRFEDVSL